MPNQDDVRRIASRLPEAVEGEGQFGFSVPIKGKLKGFVWEWAERVEPKKPRVLNTEVLAIVVRNVEIKEILEAAGGPKFVSDPHYNGFPAVLVRLDAVELNELEELIVEAWRCKAPPKLVQAFDDATA